MYKLVLRMIWNTLTYWKRWSTVEDCLNQVQRPSSFEGLGRCSQWYWELHPSKVLRPTLDFPSFAIHIKVFNDITINILWYKQIYNVYHIWRILVAWPQITFWCNRLNLPDLLNVMPFELRSRHQESRFQTYCLVRHLRRTKITFFWYLWLNYGLRLYNVEYTFYIKRQ